MSKSIVHYLVVGMLSLGLGAWAVFVGIERTGRPTTPPADRAHVAEWVARLHDPDPETRAEAYRNVIALGALAIPFLLPIVEGEDRVGKFEATRALLAIRSEAAVPALIRLVEKGEPRLRRAAIEALGLIGPRASAAIPALQDLVRSKQLHRIEKLGGFCFLPTTLARIQGAEAVPMLIEMLDVPELRIEVADALGYIGEAARAALPALEAAARDEAPGNRQIILTYLAAIRLRGTWEMTASERDGRIITAREVGAPIHWVIDEIKWSKGPVNGEKATGYLHVDSLRDPKTLDLCENGTIVGGPNNRYFIYEIDGDTLKICGVETSSDPAERPTAFKTLQEPGAFISHWKRVKTKHDAKELPKVEKGMQ